MINHLKDILELATVERQGWEAKSDALLRSGAPVALDSPTAYPLDAPTIDPDTGAVTVDELLNNPSRITRDIADMSAEQMYMQRVFAPGGGVEGGALLFERPGNPVNDRYGDREPKEIAPGEVFPLQTFQRGLPMMARPKKIGSKFFVLKEARKRNNPRTLRQDITRTVNTITRRVELMGLAELSAVVSAESRFRSGTSWSTFAGLTQANRTYTTGPVADVMAALAQADTEDRGVAYDSVILHTNQALVLKQAFPELTLQQIFAMGEVETNGRTMGIRNVFVSNRHAAGVATVFEAGAVGEWRNEFPLAAITWVDPETDETFWYQWSISPLFAVDNQFAVLEIRGIA